MLLLTLTVACGAEENDGDDDTEEVGVDEAMATTQGTVTNPILATGCADPGVLADGGKFYMVCTGGKFGIKQSNDLVHWKPAGASILPEGKPSWAANGGRNWAPELHRSGDEFLAYYTTVNAKNVLSIGVASAPSPTGPFTDKGAPLVEDGKGVIDATMFQDDDGSKWLFYKIDGNSVGASTPIYVRQLSADGLSFKRGSVAKQTITNSPSTWEGGVVEAPWVVKHDGRYYMLYSGNVYDARYRTGVARADRLTGPWEKKGAPILANNATWVGPGHGSVVSVPNANGKKTADYFVYHAWRNDGRGAADRDQGRMALIDRITWKNGWPSIGNGTPTVGPQPAPVTARTSP